ncbi:E3 ubiquitin-protein ligase rad18 [Coemansia sp. RSA 1972]|nr:E3 ubiquitin-protein ligase rad18 [Coemansia sp. RSA 1972]
MMTDDAFEDPTDWPAEFEHLRQLDQQLRCPICKEYFTTAMVATTCGHTFCSLCVRRCLNQETICPSCRAPLTESELHPNRLVDNLLRTFRAGRQQILDALTAKPIELAPVVSEYCKRCQGNAVVEEANVQRKRRRVCTRSMGILGSKEPSSEVTAMCDIDLSMSDVEGIAASDFDMAVKDCDLASVDDDSDFQPESTNRAPQVPKRPSISSVPCPNCKQSVRQSQINWHLDRCLAGKPTNSSLFTQGKPVETTSRDPTSSSPVFGISSLKMPLQPKFTLSRPTKLAYSLLSESKLRRTLKDLGIPAKGDKQQMQARHVEWVNMYMANADSETPVSHKLLLRRLAAWEDTFGRSVEPAKPNAAPDTADEHAAKYADSFADLVAQARANRKREPTNGPTAAST